MDRGMDGRPPLTAEDLDASDNVVAVMGAEPILAARCRAGPTWSSPGRACDPALFAAPLLTKATRGTSPTSPANSWSARPFARNRSPAKKASWARWSATPSCWNR